MNKKIIIIIIAGIIALIGIVCGVILCLPKNGDDVQESSVSDGLEFTLNNDGKSYSVVGIGTCTDTYIVIPKTYNGLSVTVIGSDAFAGCTSIEGIEIPDSVENIGFGAFGGCTSLTSITIPASVAYIQGSEFNGCSSLTNIIINQNNKNYKSIDGNIYSKDGTILVRYAPGKQEESFVIPNNVTDIGYYAFYGCKTIKQVEISNFVTSIGNYAFANCSSLVSITIPNGVKTIAPWTFNSCTSLTKVSIGESVISIGSNSFQNCTLLTTINFDGSTTKWNEIELSSYWNDNVPATVVNCSNGTVELK